MPHRFQKGQPRPANAGRRAGTPNKSTQDVGQFCREVLETAAFQEKWRDYFETTPLCVMEPRLLAMAFAYGYGRPHERLESAGAEGGKPLQVEPRPKLNLANLSVEDLRTLQEITLRAEGRTVQMIESDLQIESSADGTDQ